MADFNEAHDSSDYFSKHYSTRENEKYIVDVFWRVDFRPQISYILIWIRCGFWASRKYLIFQGISQLSDPSLFRYRHVGIAAKTRFNVREYIIYH